MWKLRHREGKGFPNKSWSLVMSLGNQKMVFGLRLLNDKEEGQARAMLSQEQAKARQQYTEAQRERGRGGNRPALNQDLLGSQDRPTT
jgi:hypothetical protein